MELNGNPLMERKLHGDVQSVGRKKTVQALLKKRMGFIEKL